MLHIVWLLLVTISVIYSALNRSLSELFTAATKAAESAVWLAFRLSAGYAFFCGWIKITEKLGVPGRMQKILHPVLCRLFPQVRGRETQETLVLNMTANILGLGNAATPTGIRAMELMSSEQSATGVSDSMKLFLVINATSIQLLPTTMLALRASAGSANPSQIILPTLVCTTASTVVGVIAAKLCARVRLHD